jgi:hypothetical protein
MAVAPLLVIGLDRISEGISKHEAQWMRHRIHCAAGAMEVT